MSQIIIISGERNSGKSFILERLHSAFSDAVSGIVLKKFDDDKRYVALDLSTGKNEMFCEKKIDSNFGYIFLDTGIEFAKRAIVSSLNNKITIIDEIGSLELSGKGLHDAFSCAIGSDTQLIISVGKKNLTKVIEKWKLNPIIIDIDNLCQEMAFEELKKTIANNLNIYMNTK